MKAKHTIPANHPVMFWNKDKNRFEVEISSLQAAGFEPCGNRSVASWFDICNPVTGITKHFRHNPKTDVIAIGGEIQVWIYKCQTDPNLQLHVLND
jgi:hypothetical protein